jgi:hypothetical protein
MSSPSSTPLSAEQIDALRTELDGGRQPMVWFTDTAVGMDAGRSAKVLALAQPYEGDFIQVRPTGSQDELSFSPTELTMDKPPRRKKPTEAEKPAPGPVVSAPAPEPVDELLVVRERPVKKSAAARRGVEDTVSAGAEPLSSGPTAPPERTARPAKAAGSPRGKQKLPPPITVTLSSTPEGEWTVDVLSGSRRAVRAQPVSAGSVASAARALGGDIEEAIDGALSAARDQQRARVEQLEAELVTARQALAELSE